jgi:hypothetical protein
MKHLLLTATLLASTFLATSIPARAGQAPAAATDHDESPCALAPGRDAEHDRMGRPVPASHSVKSAVRGEVPTDISFALIVAT